MKQVSDLYYSEILPFGKVVSFDSLVAELSLFPFQEQIQSHIQYNFKDSKAFWNIFIHKSFSHEAKFDVPNNERLEFLGDAVLQLLMSDLLMERFPEKKEGDLSKMRSSVVNELSLFEIASKFNLGHFLLLGKGEFKSGPLKESIVSDCFEALLGAVYSEGGFSAAKNTFEHIMLKQNNIDDILSENKIDSFDSKSKLQELVMARFKTVPQYKSTEISKNGKTYFVVEVEFAGKKYGAIEHISKKKGMQLLAKKTLEQLNI